MNLDVSTVLITEDEIKKTVRRIAQEITRDFQGEEVTFIGALTGAFIFMADLVREVDLPVTIDFIKASSYRNKTTSDGNVQITKDISFDIEGKNILIIEDIIDTGNTLRKLKQHFLLRNPKNIKLVTFLDKPSRRLVDIESDYVGIKIPDEFAVGYGLDYDNKFRNLPYIACLKFL